MLLHSKSAADFSRARNVGSVLFNHDPARIIGSIERLWVDEGDRRGRATIRFDETPEGETAFTRVQSGSLRGVSVSALMLKVQRIGEHEAWRTPDGRELKGPLNVVKKWQVAEISLTAVPADHSIGIGRNKKEATMPPISAEIRQALIERGMAEGATDEEALEYIKGLETPKAATPPAETPPVVNVATRTDGDILDVLDVQKRAEEGRVAERGAAIQERERIDELTRIQEKTGIPKSELDLWISRDTTPAAARQAGLEFLVARHRPVGKGGARVEVLLDDRRKLLRSMEAHVCRRARTNLAGNPESWKYDEKACEDINSELPIIEVARELLIKAGEPDARHWNRLQVATRAMSHSTSDFPYLLENVANKSLGVGYAEARTTWEAWCSVGNLPDFKSASRVAVGDTDAFEVVKELMPITEASMSEKRETRELSTYAKRFGVSRQALINDDLTEFARTPQKLGASAARTINATVYEQLTSPPTMAEDSTALFATTHTSGGNLATSAAAPSAATLGAAMTFMRKQKGLGAKATLNIIPKYIILPAAHEMTVQQILAASIPSFMPTSAANAITRWMLNLIPITEPLLDASSATAWFLAADQNEVDTIKVEFLNGNQTPTIVRVDGQAVLGMEWIAFIDFSVKVFDHRGLYKNAGA